jgi:hypothetical protein
MERIFDAQLDYTTSSPLSEDKGGKGVTSKLTQMRESTSISSESSSRLVVNLTLHAGDCLLFVYARDSFSLRIQVAVVLVLMRDYADQVTRSGMHPDDMVQWETSTPNICLWHGYRTGSYV